MYNILAVTLAHVLYFVSLEQFGKLIINTRSSKFLYTTCFNEIKKIGAKILGDISNLNTFYYLN